METLIKELNQYLSDLSVFYRKLQNYHWNIKGKSFFVVHAKLEEYYNEINEQIDEVAEHILAIGGIPLATLKDYLNTTKITEAKNEKVTTEQPTTIAYKDKADITVSKVKNGISVTISNFTKDQINFDYSFGNLEKYSDGKWVKALPDNAQYINQEPLITLSYGQSHTFSISFGSQDYESWVLFDGTLENGKYRYTHKVTPVNGKAYEVCTEFDY